MLRPILIGRHCLLYKETRLCHSSFRKFSNNSEDDRNKKSAADKLNSLLLTIVKEENTKPVTKIQLPKPTKSRLAKKPDVSKKTKQISLGEKLVSAAGEVAKKIDGPPKETEAKLLHRLLYKDENLKKDVLQSAPDNENLSSLLKTMTVETESTKKESKIKTSEPMSKAEQIRSLLGHKKPVKKKVNLKGKKLNIFSAKPLGIFNPKTAKDEGIKLKTWDKCHERELKLSITHPPASYYEQMINWTEKGLIWKFPIDNEQGLEEEKKVSFSDHVFLENYLEDWCPTSGPVRHFMELVCVGLSRNHWLSAEEKKSHILWYKEFFTEKKELLKEIGAGEMEVQNSPESKQ